VADFIGGPLDQNKDKYAKASPVTYVTKAAPPILLIHGEKDAAVAIEDSITMAKKLKAVGADVKMITVKNARHGLWPEPKGAVTDPSLDETVAATLDFFDKHLGKSVTRRAATQGHT